MIKTFFNKLSIKYKLVLTQLSIVFIVLIFNNLLFLYFDLKSNKLSLVTKMHSTAGMISQNLSSTLIFKDPISATEILKSLKNEKEFSSAWVYDDEGMLFAKYVKDSSDNVTFSNIGNITIQFKKDFAIVSQIISKDNEEYGTLYIRMKTTQYKESVKFSVFIILEGLILGMMIAILLSVYSQKKIIEPINNLISTIDNIISTKKYSTLIAKSREDEIGKLYDEFNIMIKQIRNRERDKDLVLNALQKSEQSLKNAQKLAKIGNWTLNLKTEEVMWSEQLYEIFELENFGITNKKYMSMIHPDDLDRVEKVFETAIRDRKTKTVEYRIITKRGIVKYILDTGKEVVDENQNVIALEGTIQDISKIKKAEEALKKANYELEERVMNRTMELEIAKEKAEGSDRLKSAFLASMSHELRTPLNSIIGFSGILIQGLVGPLNPEQKKQLGMVQKSSKHLLNLINDVLDISKIEAGQMTVEIKPYDFDESLRSTVESLIGLAKKNEISLELEIGDHVNIISSDQRRVEQILINLINNAIKFTDKGLVQVCSKIVDDEVVVSVKDTGIGIKEEDLKKLFKPFIQIETGLSRKYEGTGLGLSICKKLLDLLGGRIEVESEVGVGSIFSFTLPIKKGESNE